MKITKFTVGYVAEHEQYYQGHGLAYSGYSISGQGCGDTLAEALEEALDSLAEQEVEITKSITKAIEGELASQSPYDLDTPISTQCDNYEDHLVQLEKGEDPDCPICAGAWHYYVYVDVK